MPDDDRPWEERDWRRHPRADELRALEHELREAQDALLATLAIFRNRHDELSARIDPLRNIVHGDLDRLTFKCDRCGHELTKREQRPIDATVDWIWWTVDDDSGDMACRCPKCVAETEATA